jgi:DNA-binding SARP family transcriptional activator
VSLPRRAETNGGSALRPTKDRYEELIALAPDDYDGPEHTHHAPYVAILDADGVVVEAEDAIRELATPGRALHPGRGGDRPPPSAFAAGTRRSVFVAAAGEPAEEIVRVRALGCTEVEGDASSGRWLGHRPGCLLKFLVCRRYRPVHAERIAETLWGHSGFVSSGTVRQCVHDLRAKFNGGSADPRRPLVVTRQCGYVLSGRVVVDADDFAAHVRRGVTAHDRGRDAIAVAHLRRAVSMYGGDFLSDEPHADWAHLERERLREHMEDALGTLAELYLAADDASAATLCLRRLCEMRPYDPDAHEQLLAVLLAQGRYSHARRSYEALCGRLRREFATAPGYALRDLTPSAPTRTQPAAAPVRRS